MTNNNIRIRAYRAKDYTARWLKNGILPTLSSTKQVKYEAFSTSGENLEVFVKKQGNHPTKTLALNWLACDKLLPPKFSLLDIGCGPGVFARMIAEHPLLADRIAYTGIDQSEDALTYCRSKYPGNYEFVKCELQSEPLPFQTDVLVLNEVIEHLPNYQDIITASINNGPKIFVLTTFGVVPGRRRDRRMWNDKERCYMNSYSFDRLYEFLRSKTDDLRVADFGTQEFDRFWFPQKTLLLFYMRIGSKKITWSPEGWNE